MTLPATKKNSIVSAIAQTNQPTSNEEVGWDPFEIWRTRVLLPRLAETHEINPVPTPAIKIVRR